jgi:hypothetical protein
MFFVLERWRAMSDDSRNSASEGIDLDKIAKIVAEYYEAVVSSPDGTADLDGFVSCPLSKEEEEFLRLRLADVEFLFELTSPLRDAQAG